ncbi:MAG: hypothetical protein LC789_12060 [Actinobacteria bacterium]|nr:hypothetical protein [Actinomycetota bacterium]
MPRRTKVLQTGAHRYPPTAPEVAVVAVVAAACSAGMVLGGPPLWAAALGTLALVGTLSGGIASAYATTWQVRGGQLVRRGLVRRQSVDLGALRSVRYRPIRYQPYLALRDGSTTIRLPLAVLEAGGELRHALRGPLMAHGAEDWMLGL